MPVSASTSRQRRRRTCSRRGRSARAGDRQRRRRCSALSASCLLVAGCAGAAFEGGCRDAYAREYQFSEDRAPELIIIAAEGDVFARGAGYALIAELFSSR